MFNICKKKKKKVCFDILYVYIVSTFKKMVMSITLLSACLEEVIYIYVYTYLYISNMYHMI